MRKRSQLAAVLAAAALSIAGTSHATTISDSTFTLDFGTSSIATATLNGTPLDFGSHYYLRGTCLGIPGASVPVVSGTSATFSGTCGSFNVAVTIRLLSPVPSLPTTSGGFEMEFAFTNPTLGTLPLEAIVDSDSDLVGAGDDVAGYDAASKAVYNMDTVASPSVLTAMIATSDQPGATFGWDVGALGTCTTAFPMDNGVVTTGPTDTETSMGYQQTVPAGDTAKVKFRMLYARGVTTVPTDFDFSSCYSSPQTTCRLGTKSQIEWKNDADNAKDKFQWKLLNADATSQTEFSDPTVDADYTVCMYDGTGEHLAGEHVAASATKWAVIGDHGYKYKDADATSFGIGKAQVKGSDTAKSKLLFKGAGNNLSDPTLGALITPIQVQANAGGMPGLCFSSSFATTIKNDIDQLKAKVP